MSTRTMGSRLIQFGGMWCNVHLGRIEIEILIVIGHQHVEVRASIRQSRQIPLSYSPRPMP